MIGIRFIDSRLCALARSSWVLPLRVTSINIYPCYVMASILTMARSLAALCTHIRRPINSHLRVGFHSRLLRHIGAVSKVRPAWIRSHIFPHFSITSQCGSKISSFFCVCARVFFSRFFLGCGPQWSFLWGFCGSWLYRLSQGALQVSKINKMIWLIKWLIFNSAVTLVWVCRLGWVGLSQLW